VKKLLFLLSFLLAVPLSAQYRFAPPANQAVTDSVGILSEQENQALERQLRRFNDTSSTQLAVVIVKSLKAQGYDISDYTIQLAKYWKIGKQGKNNGLLLLVAVDDRQYFTATGYGLEGGLPDGTVKLIEERYIKPNFRQNQYYQGISQTMNAYAQAVGGEFKADAPADEGGGNGILIFIFILFLLFIIFRMFRGRRGGGGGGYYRGGGGFIPFVTFSGGGSSGGSGFGGGGFNFGGGDFGGGGAGGDW
jgi:uncharacterized protein